MNMKTMSACMCMALVAAVSAYADDHRYDKEYNLDKKGLALQGYDPVAYFPEAGGEAVKGKSSITHTIDDTTYHFATEANKAKFVEDPAKYEPAYGGWCAYAMGAKGEKFEANPKAFRIQDGRLFVFYKTLITDTRKPWDKDPKSLESKADENWDRIIDAAKKAE